MHLLLLTTALCCILFPQVHAKCRSFIPTLFRNTDQYVYTFADQTYRASAITNCSTLPGQTAPGTVRTPTFSCLQNQCLVQTPANWTIRLNRTISIDVNQDLQNDIFTMATRFFGSDIAKTDLNTTKVYTVLQFSGCINETQAGYWGYSPIYNCVDGVLEQCIPPDEPLSGTSVRVCGIRTIDTARRQADAELHFVYASGVESGPPPANAIENGALRSVGSGGWVLSNVLFAFMFAVVFESDFLA